MKIQESVICATFNTMKPGVLYRSDLSSFKSSRFACDGNGNVFEFRPDWDLPGICSQKELSENQGSAFLSPVSAVITLEF